MHIAFHPLTPLQIHGQLSAELIGTELIIAFETAWIRHSTKIVNWFISFPILQTETFKEIIICSVGNDDVKTHALKITQFTVKNTAIIVKQFPRKGC